MNSLYIAVLITCHNRSRATLKCLEYLFNVSLNDNIKYDVHLVDDGSNDGTSELVHKKFPKVNIINGNGQLYWNRGMYKAWKTASSYKVYDYYLWLNDDTYLFQNSITELIECSLARNNQSVIVGFTCSESNKDSVTYGGRTNGGLLVPNGMVQSCDYFNGNIVLVPRIIFERVGNLERFYSHSFGDFDYGIRVRNNGFGNFTSKNCIGFCEANNEIKKWCSPSESIYTRIRLLYTPLGCNPFELFLMESRRFNVLIAMFHFFTVHLRVIIPSLWLKKY
jgi:GT2 family glycosyltransferase